MSVWHLVWIIPASACLGFICCAALSAWKISRLERALGEARAEEVLWEGERYER